MQISNLPGHSRVWIFQSDRKLRDSEEAIIRRELDQFIPQWAAHGSNLYGGFAVQKKCFIVIGVDETKAPASGCSIDALTRVIKELGAQLKIDFFNRLCLAVEMDAETIEIMSMEDFKRKIVDGVVNPDTIVYNNLVRNKAELDEGWRTKAKNSWHSNLFSLV